MSLAPVLAALLGLLCLTTASAAPYVPASDAQIVETLRERPLDATDRAARRLRQEARRQPRNLALALAAARDAIGLARRDGDPRQLGLAQAALAPWWALAEPPPAVLLLRATVLQSQHAFAAALADLDRLLADPATPLALRAQAELTRASLLQVQGRYAEAAAGCERLASARYFSLGAGAAWIAEVCSAELRSLQGHARQAKTELVKLADRAVSPDQVAWLALVRAELAGRMADDADAQALYRQALAASGRPDVYLLGSYADWLLDHGRASEAASLLAGREAADALLLRLALAYQSARDPRAAGAIATLRERFEAAKLRGDALHRREEARMRLQLLGEPQRALSLATENWGLQKEPADTRLLLEAAAAANQASAAQPVLRFIRETGYVDARLARWLP
ncbi:MAG TPA: hypothetical protein VFV25_11225 [Methylibium sp.]